MKLQGLLALVNVFPSEKHIRIGYAIIRVWCSRMSCASPRGSPNRKARHMSSWGIRMELIWIALRAPFHLGAGSLHLAHGEKFYPAGIPPHPDISYPDGKGGRSVRQHFTSGYLISEWEKRAFQLPRLGISESIDSAYLERFAAFCTIVFSWSFPICATDILGYFEIFLL